MEKVEVALSEVEGQKNWHVYILECRRGSLYTGIAKNLQRRMLDHKNKRVHYTSYNLPVKLVFEERFQTQSAAMKRERQIKGWTKKKKLALIAGDLQLLKKL